MPLSVSVYTIFIALFLIKKVSNGRSEVFCFICKQIPWSWRVVINGNICRFLKLRYEYCARLFANVIVRPSGRFLHWFEYKRIKRNASGRFVKVIRSGRRSLRPIRHYNHIIWPEMKQDYPLNLSILISGGKETNKDCLSNCEWTGKSPDW